MTNAVLTRFVEQIAETLATSTREFIERRLDERFQRERLHVREIIRAELEARLPPSIDANPAERRLQ